MSFRQRFLKAFPNPLEVDSTFATLANEYSEFCRLEQLPYLSHGYYGQRAEAHGQHPMKVLRITAPNASTEKPAVLLMRSHHAREWINAIAVVETARQLLENYRPNDADPRVHTVVSILDNIEVMIIPEANPDGARLSFFDSGYRMWRKNLRPNGGSNCSGVDCNRNYPRYWGELGSSGNPCAGTYRGPAALSEPESSNIAHFTELNRNIIFAIDSHSYGEAIFRPTKSGGKYIPSLPVSDEDELIYGTLEAAMNDGISRVQGNRYRTGTTNMHAGTSDEFFFFERQIYGIVLESGTEFLPSFAEANMAALEVAEALKALALCAIGRTGLDIQALLNRRKSPTQHELAATREPVVASKPMAFHSQSREQWRRFIVECRAKWPTEVVREILELEEKGCDVVRYANDKLEMVVGTEDLSELARSGYRPEVVRDLASEDAWRG